MKGIVFAGCSFTHGHGLWNYGDFSGKGTDDQPNHDKIETFERFTQSRRFARLVANYFNSWEYVRKGYSGDDETSIGIINHMFDIDSPIQFTQEAIKFDFDDISHLIFQTSYIDRCPIILDENCTNRVRLRDIAKEHQIETLISWGCDTYEIYINKLKHQWYSQVRKLFKFLESKGIKCYMISITDDYLSFIDEDEYIRNKFIEIDYKNKKFKTITELLDFDNSLMISKDFKNLKNPPEDKHPSLICHEIISNSIINNIKNDF